MGDTPSEIFPRKNMNISARSSQWQGGAGTIITGGVIYGPGQWETRVVWSNDSHNLLILDINL